MKSKDSLARLPEGSIKYPFLIEGLSQRKISLFAYFNFLLKRILSVSISGK